MKVLLVAHQYWPTPGSATQVLDAVVRELVHRGHSVDVITCRPPQGIAHDRRGPHGERIYFGAPAERSGAGLLRLVALAVFAIGVLTHGIRMRPDAVVSDPPPTAGWAAWLVARMRRARFVYYMADSWGGASAGMNGLAGRAHRMIQLLENGLLKRADSVLAATEGMAAIASEAGADSITVVHNGAPLDKFGPIGETWRPSNRPFFLYAGNAGKVHGAAVFAEAAKVLWSDGLDFDLVFIGHGADFADIRATIGPAESRAHFLGTQPTEKIAAAFRAATGALTSLRPIERYSDARPIKTMTGLAAGCPAIYAGDGRFADVLREAGLGFITPWSVDGAADSMRQALDLHEQDPAGEAALRKRCAEYAETNLSDKTSAATAAAVILNDTNLGAAR